MNDLELVLLKKIIKGAGKILLENYNRNLKIENKEDGSLASRADKKSSNFIYENLKKYFPNYDIVDEERGENQKKITNEYCWVVDPLDDTRGYLNKEDTFSILIGLLKNKTPMFGMSYRPLEKELVWAIKGKGAYLEDPEEIKKIRANSSSVLNVSVSKSRENKNLDELLTKINPNRIIKMGGSIKIIEIAKCNANIFICPKGNPMHMWDLCATSVILEEAGGIITDLNFNALDFKKKDTTYNLGILAASGMEIYEKVKRKIN